MTRAVIRISIAAALLAAIGAGWSAVKSNIHPPLRRMTQIVPYDPERIIRTTLHDYRSGGREHETTGRYTTFSIPMKVLWPYSIYPDQVPLSFKLLADWAPDSTGTWRRVSILNEDGFVDDALQPRAVLTTLSSAGAPKLKQRNKMFVAARRSGERFPGHRPGSSFVTKVYWLDETYCGFELFQSDDPRDWHREPADTTLPAPEAVPEPFDRARLFGWPDDAGGYTLTIHCRDLPQSRLYCNSSYALNDYISFKLNFEPERLCDAPKIHDGVRRFLAEHSEQHE